MAQSETKVQQDIRLAGAERGVPLLRNNSGALKDVNGRSVRFGLGNDSAKINKVFKSSDLIGIWPVLITPEHVGMTLGVFTAVECKPEGWKRTPGDERATAQANFGDWVVKHGGVFRFATNVKDVFG